MRADSDVPPKDQAEKPTFLAEVTNIEKQLWANIRSKGLLHPDVRDLYRKACLSYEKFFLSDHGQAELQDLEYSLWKLHYKHIDEFRKIIKQNSAESTASTDSLSTCDGLVKEFKSFLSKATDYYQNLIQKVEKRNGPQGNNSKSKGIGVNNSSEPNEIQKCNFLRHRFYICLGDLARYKELYATTADSGFNWSVALSHYQEAAVIWPHSGNPHNQLAVLATYVGDDFLALYHCLRSLAVKEPFPDAWNNLVVLLERSCSSPWESESSESPFDFSKPFKKCRVETNSRPSEEFSNCSVLKAEQDYSSGTRLWALLVRVMSFFFLESSFNNFPCIFASAMRELDAVMAADDELLGAILESYQLMDSARTGPFRTLQIISIFIFIIYNLYNLLEPTGSVGEKGEQHLKLTQYALSVAFIITGRFLERCLKANPIEFCPLLAAVLVFVEFLPFVLDKAEAYGVDDKVQSAVSYFFGALADLLKKLKVKKEVPSAQKTALWEDYELIGFAPMASVHVSLDFSMSLVNRDAFRGTQYRVQRIVSAGMKIVKRLNNSRKWIMCDESRREACAAESKANYKGKTLERGGNGETLLDKECRDPAIEEEEVILFKPLTRYNSAPLNAITTKKERSLKKSEDQTLASDEFLRRATSLLIDQNPKENSSFCPDTSSFTFSRSFTQQESAVKNNGSQSLLDCPISASPPSLSAWVLDGETFCSNKDAEEPEKRDNGLSIIDEIASASVSDLYIDEDKNLPDSSASHESEPSRCSPPSYSVPVPSAPLLPEDATWFTGTERARSFYGSPQVSSYPHQILSPSTLSYNLPLPNFTYGYPFAPFSGISSGEWLRRYREAHNLEPSNSNKYYYQANLRNFLGHESSRFGLLDRYGTPTDPTSYIENSRVHPGFVPLSMGNDHGREKLLQDHNRPSPYEYGAVPNPRNYPQPPFLYHFPEKE